MRTVDKNLSDLVRQSYGRCLQDKGFLDKFYDTFLASSNEVKAKFANTDFAKQKQLLSHGLNMLIMFSSGNAVASGAMNRLRKSHAKDALDIAPRLYDYWRNSLLKTIRQCDSKCDAATESAWRNVLAIGIEYIQEGYQKPAA